MRMYYTMRVAVSREKDNWQNRTGCFEWSRSSRHVNTLDREKQEKRLGSAFWTLPSVSPALAEPRSQVES